MARECSSLTLIEMTTGREPVARLRGFLLRSRFAEFDQIFDVVRIFIFVLVELVGPHSPRHRSLALNGIHVHFGTALEFLEHVHKHLIAFLFDRRVHILFFGVMYGLFIC